jgi:hypothetical protein
MVGLNDVKFYNTAKGFVNYYICAHILCWAAKNSLRGTHTLPWLIQEILWISVSFVKLMSKNSIPDKLSLTPHAEMDFLGLSVVSVYVDIVLGRDILYRL